MGWEVREITFKHHKEATTYDVVDQSGGLIAPDVAPSDARLIAAAPEMLEALRAVADCKFCILCQTCRNKVDAAIAKAEGRTE